MMRRFAALLVALALAALPAAAATDMSDPRAVVVAAYAPYTSGEDFDWAQHDEAALRSEGLNALYARDAAESQEEVGRIDFDPLINGQDWTLTDFEIGPAEVAGDTATVLVTFKNFDQPQEVLITLVREGEAFKIDNVQNAGAEYPYDLRDILEAPLPR